MGMEIIIFLSVGIFAGTLAGMFGIGGGVIIVPALIASFIYLGFDQVITTHLAIGTSLASIFFTGIASAYSHNQKKGVVWKIFYPLSSGIAVGAILGAFIAGNISGDSLRYLVGIFLIIVAIQLISSFEIKASKRESHSISSVLSGSGIGMASSIIGIGGGSFTVPYLRYFGYEMKLCIGTAAACGVPIALFGSLGYLYTGWSIENTPSMSLGYIYLPAVIGISATSIFAEKIGVAITHSLSDLVLKILFSLFLIIGALYMLAI
tara:strand:+ start:335 stop:1126 length:792 start_codon:yes stop_codon:yes gene_type:complete